MNPDPSSLLDFGALGLLAIVLIGVGTFLWRVGLKIVESVDHLTDAVEDQTRQFRQMTDKNTENTARILDLLTRAVNSDDKRGGA